MSALAPAVVALRLARGAALFRFLDAEDARARMRPMPAQDSFEVKVAHRLEILRELNRRRRALEVVQAQLGARR